MAAGLEEASGGQCVEVFQKIVGILQAAASPEQERRQQQHGDKDPCCLLQQKQDDGMSSLGNCSVQQQQQQHDINGLGTAVMLSMMLVDLAWEKLHTGHWEHVPLVWRDCYALACLSKATLDLLSPPQKLTTRLLQQCQAMGEVQGQVQQQQQHHAMGDVLQQQKQQEEQQATRGEVGMQQQQQQQQQQQRGREEVQQQQQQQCMSAALRQLDLGIMMGGPTFRQLLDEAVEQLEKQLAGQAARQLPGTAAGTPVIKMPGTITEQVAEAGVTGAAAQAEWTGMDFQGRRLECHFQNDTVPAKGKQHTPVQGVTLRLPFSGAKRKLPSAWQQQQQQQETRMLQMQQQDSHAVCNTDGGSQPFSDRPHAQQQVAEAGVTGAAAQAEWTGMDFQGRGLVRQGNSHGVSGTQPLSIEDDHAVEQGRQELQEQGQAAGHDGTCTTAPARQLPQPPQARAGSAGCGSGEPVLPRPAVRLPLGSLLQGEGHATRPPVLHLPSMEEFLVQLMLAPDGGRPAVITGAMEAWPAMSRWQDIQYILQAAGHRTVPIEVGQHYLADVWGQKLMTVGEFIAQHVVVEASAPSPTTAAAAGPAGNKAAGEAKGVGTCSAASAKPAHHEDTAPGQSAAGLPVSGAAPLGRVMQSESRERAEQQQHCDDQQQQEQHERCDGQQQQQQGLREARQLGYLAQHPLFDQVPTLRADICVPEYCALGEGELQSINAWFGPAGTLTPLHYDPHHNLLAQVVGKKYVRLYAPCHSPKLYPHSEGLTTNSSQINLEADAGPDGHYPNFPGFGDLPFQDCVLQPGQMLYIPPGWWHYVKSLSVSFSVSFWWK